MVILVRRDSCSGVLHQSALQNDNKQTAGRERAEGVQQYFTFAAIALQTSPTSVS